MIRYKLLQTNDIHSIHIVIIHQDKIGFEFNDGSDTFVALDGFQLKSRLCPAWSVITNSSLYVWGQNIHMNLLKVEIPLYSIKMVIDAIGEYNKIGG